MSYTPGSGGGGGGVDWFSDRRAEAVAALGSVDGYTEFMEEFFENSRWVGGTITQSTTYEGGVVTHSSSNAYLNGRTVHGSSAFFWAYRGRLVGTGAGSEFSTMGLFNGAANWTLHMGLIRTVSTTNFALDGSSNITPTVSTIPLDTTAFHTLRVWRVPGGALKFQVDGEAAITVTPNDTINAELLRLALMQTAPALDNNVLYDSVYFAGAKAA